MSRTVLILGSGLAGYGVAREFRKLDTEAELLILSRDSADSYSKPMLSNAFSGKRSAETLVMRSREKMAAELNASIHARSAVSRIDPVARTVEFSGEGESVSWDVLVLALGADPIRLPLDGDAAQEVLSVNDLDDFARYAAALEGAKKVVLLGGGLIGCEFANDLLARDVQPLVVELGGHPLGRLLPEEAAGFFRSRLEAAGVEFRLGVAAQGVDRQGEGYRVRLADGSQLDADLVVSCVGLRPRTELAATMGCEVARGIVTDRFLQSSLPNVYAVGDCAEIAGLNLPFVMPIMHQSRALAATLAGTPTELNYPAMPVSVKTPACPAVVCPPPQGAEGSWKLEQDAEGVTARFEAADGALLGFALLGAATARRQELAAQAPKPFAS